MTKKKIQFEKRALQSLSRGIQVLGKAVKMTLGPFGKNVILVNEDELLSTKEGRSVAKALHLTNKEERLGIKLIREAGEKTIESVGDGSSTAIVIAETLFSLGMRMIQAGSCPMDLKKGIDLSVKVLLEELKQMAKPLKEQAKIQKLASIAANHDESIGWWIQKAYEKVGVDGLIAISCEKDKEEMLQIRKGFQIESGYLSPYFVTNGADMSTQLKDPLIFVTDIKLDQASDISSILEKSIERKKPLLIIAKKIEGEALQTLILNKVKGEKEVAAIEVPLFGEAMEEILEDVSLMTGATFLSSSKGESLDSFTPSYFGSAKEVFLEKGKTTLIEGAGDPNQLKQRAEILKKGLHQTNLDLRKRIANLLSKVATLQVSSASEMETRERVKRIERATLATRAALLDGTVPGGGAALLLASNKLNEVKEQGDVQNGVEIMKKAIRAPFIQICENAGKNGEYVAEKVLEMGLGFDVNTKKFLDFSESGVLDPLKVVQSALIYGASSAANTLTISAMITEIDPI